MVGDVAILRDFLGTTAPSRGVPGEQQDRLLRGDTGTRA